MQSNNGGDWVECFLGSKKVGRVEAWIVKLDR